MTSLRSVFKILFEDESSRIVSGDKFNKQVRTVEEVIREPGEFFTINELKPEAKSREVADIAVFRNILVELDHGSLEEQVNYIEELKMPYTAAVYSGGKSIHFIISLENPFPNSELYYEMTDFLLEHVVTRADKSNKNPNRYSRTPDFIRPDSGRVQEVLDLKERVTWSQMTEFLKPYWKIWLIEKRRKEKAERIKQVKRKMMGDNIVPLELIGPRTKDFIENGAFEGDRHARLTSAVTDLFMNGMELPDIETLLIPACEKSGISDRGDLEQIISWAERKLVR